MKKIISLFVVIILLTGCAHKSPVEHLPYLQGKTSDQIRSTFGRPSVIRKEKNATLWSYYQDNCSSLLFFDHTDTVRYAELRGECKNQFAQK